MAPSYYIPLRQVGGHNRGTNHMKRLLIIFSLLFATSLSAKESILVLDVQHEKVIVAQDSTIRRPLASITKLMTAMVALDLGLNEPYLIDTLLVQSNNHSAEVIASLYGRDKFVRLMNFKAHQLGMTDTRFIDPSGLGMNVSTAEDIAIMIAQAIQYSEIRATAFPTVQTVIPKGKRAQLALLNNTNYNLLKEFTHINGSKTGYTHAAGWCVAMTTDSHIVVILGSNSKAARNTLARKLIRDHTIPIRPKQIDFASL